VTVMMYVQVLFWLRREERGGGGGGASWKKRKGELDVVFELRKI
jgi:hypothetical protein